MLERARTRLRAVVRLMASAGISADSVTITCCALGAFAGALVARGQFAAAALAMGVASVGDALGGDLARRQGTACVRGAILDATVDRYEEFFFLAGLAFFFRADPVVLALVLLAIIGSFMVSYGSAKAEGYGIAVPGGMRRAERASCLVFGTALVPLAELLADRNLTPHWSRHIPVIVAIGLIGGVGNISAIVRLRAIGRAASRL